MLESRIEAEVCRTLRMLGCLVRKDGQEGWPDRVVYVGDSLHFWIEFKQPGKTPEPLQLARHAALRYMGEVVLVLDYAPSYQKLSEMS